MRDLSVLPRCLDWYIAYVGSCLQTFQESLSFWTA